MWPSYRAERWEHAPSVEVGRNRAGAIALVITACVLLVAGAISGATWPLVGAVLGAGIGAFVAGFPGRRSGS
jgi:hypothetical protein